jgi:HK97 family phage major capsid protein
MNRKKILEEQVGLIAEVKSMRDTASKDGREFTSEEQERWDTVNDRLSAIETDLVRDDQLLDLERRQRERAGETITPENPQQPENRQTPEDAAKRELRAFEFYMGDRSDENREAFNRMGFRLAYEGGKEWVEVDLRDTRSFRADASAYKRAQSVGVDTAGGYTVPEGFVPNLERALLDFGGMREEAEVIRTATGNDLPWPTTDDTSNKGIEIAENTAVTEQDVVFGQTIWYAWKYTSKMVKVSAELLQDTAFDLPSILGSMLGERLGRITNERYTTGDATNKPEGITVGSTLGVTAAAVNAVTADELINLQHSVDPAYRMNGRFMFNDTTLRNIRKLKDGNGQYLWQPGLQAGVPGVLLGQGYRINQDMPAMTTGLIPIVYGDLMKYKIRDIQSIRFRRLVERYAESDQEAFVAFFRTDGKLLDAGTNPVKNITMA